MNRCGTYYPLFSHLDALPNDVSTFLVKQGVPSDEDLESIYPSCSLYEKEVFRVFRSIANQRYKWYVTKSVYVAMTVFLTGWKKKAEDIFCPRMWAWIFRVKRCTVGMRNGMAQIGLKTKSQGDVLLEKEKALLLQLIWMNESVGSNNMFWSYYFFTFVIMQVVLLNIFVGERWNAVMKSRLQVTPLLRK